MTTDQAPNAWTAHPGGPLRYRADSRFGADGLPPGGWFGRVSAALEAPDGSVVVFQRGPAIEPVVFLDRDGKYLRSWDQGFDLPHGMRLMPDGTLWLTDAGRHRVLKTTLDGEILMELGTADVAGTDERTFNKPTDVAVAADGTIYVSDGYGNCRVVMFDRDGTYRGSWGVPGTAPGEFDTPHSVAVAPDGSIWVSDRGNLRIQRFEPDGRYIETWGDLGAVQCIEFYEDELWVITHRSIGELLGWDSLGGRLMKVDPASGAVLGSIPLAGHFFHCAPSGDIWVGALNGTVVRLTSDWSDLAGEMEPAR